MRDGTQAAGELNAPPKSARCGRSRLWLAPRTVWAFGAVTHRRPKRGEACPGAQLLPWGAARCSAEVLWEDSSCE